MFLLLLLSGGVDPTDPLLLPSSENHSAIIFKIANPVLALSKDDIRVLMYTGDKLKFILGHPGNLQLTPELQGEFVDLNDSSEILKMFWIMKVAPPRLRNLTKSNWNFIAVDPGTRLLQLVTFSNEDEIEISHLDNLDHVVKCIYWYREEVFRSMAAKDTSKSNETSSTPDENPTPSSNGASDSVAEESNGQGNGENLYFLLRVIEVCFYFCLFVLVYFYGVGQACVLIERAIVNLLQPASTQCGVGPVCVPIELLSTYFNLPQPSVMLIQCVSP